jgi:Crp-like helix-turn-helix domain
VLLFFKTAPERVVQFLHEMAERERAKRDIELPMIRQDIADYLGLTIETASRVLERLERTAAISLLSNRAPFCVSFHCVTRELSAASGKHADFGAISCCIDGTATPPIPTRRVKGLYLI